MSTTTQTERAKESTATATAKTSTMNIPVEPDMLRDIGILARLKGMKIRELVRSLIADAIERELNPATLKTPAAGEASQPAA